jgi:hypothetical protein
LQASQKEATEIREEKRWKTELEELVSSGEKRDQNENWTRTDILQSSWTLMKEENSQPMNYSITRDNVK